MLKKVKIHLNKKNNFFIFFRFTFLYYSNKIKKDKITLTKKKQLQSLWKKTDFKKKFLKNFKKSDDFSLKEFNLWYKQIRYELDFEINKHHLNKKQISKNKKLFFSKNKKETFVDFVFLLKKSHHNAAILNYNKSSAEHYMFLRLYSFLYNESSKNVNQGHFSGIATSIHNYHITHLRSGDYKQFHHLGELQMDQNYDSLIDKLKHYNIFYNSTGNKFSTLYDRSVFLSSEELSLLELEYYKSKAKQPLLNKHDILSVQKVYTDLNYFTILNSKGECFYSKDMLDHYPSLKSHDIDLVKVPNSVSENIKYNISSFSLDDVKTVSKLGQAKMLLNDIFHDACIEHLKSIKHVMPIFKKYIYGIKDVYKDIKKNIHELDEIKINNNSILFPSKNEIIPLCALHFEPKKTNTFMTSNTLSDSNNIISIEATYNNGFIKKYHFNYDSLKFSFEKAGILEADQLGGESPFSYGDEDTSI